MLCCITSADSPHHLRPVPENLHGHVAGPVSVRNHANVMKLSLEF